MLEALIALTGRAPKPGAAWRLFGSEQYRQKGLTTHSGLFWIMLSVPLHSLALHSEPREIDLISLGNRHFSFREIKQVAELCQGRTKKEDVAVIVTCGRAQYGLASQAGYVEELEKFGAQFLQDTCWCAIEEPVITKNTQTIMTNSGKYIHYGPGLTGMQFAFGSLEMCINAVCTRDITRDPPAWLLEARSS
ncbi:hypothetical protein N7467_011164 [Penicillium canescens]|nr:hypothetical protein N7467_011164 [Penicillium canescens]